MLKTVHRYEQTAARLVVEGYPDLSDGQEGDTIGILSGWKLQLVGAPELEGTRRGSAKTGVMSEVSMGSASERSGATTPAPEGEAGAEGLEAAHAACSAAISAALLNLRPSLACITARSSTRWHRGSPRPVLNSYEVVADALAPLRRRSAVSAAS